MSAIHGVIVTPFKKYEDTRGWVTEIYRTDEIDSRPAMCYASYSHNGIIRGPHEHVYQSDLFCFYGPGDFEMHLWDNRPNSKTYKKYIKTTVGDSNPCSVLVPPGVVHGYKCISANGAFYVNLPDKLYKGIAKKDEVDEIRHEHETDSQFKII